MEKVLRQDVQGSALLSFFGHAELLQWHLVPGVVIHYFFPQCRFLDCSQWESVSGVGARRALRAQEGIAILELLGSNRALTPVDHSGSTCTIIGGIHSWLADHKVTSFAKYLERAAEEIRQKSCELDMWQLFEQAGLAATRGHLVRWATNSVFLSPLGFSNDPTWSTEAVRNLLEQADPLVVDNSGLCIGWKVLGNLMYIQSMWAVHNPTTYERVLSRYEDKIVAHDRRNLKLFARQLRGTAADTGRHTLRPTSTLSSVRT